MATKDRKGIKWRGSAARKIILADIEEGALPEGVSG